MKKYFPIILSLLIIGCSVEKKQTSKLKKAKMTQKDIKNEELRNYSFLKDMYSDKYFPNFLVDKGEATTIWGCAPMELKNA